MRALGVREELLERFPEAYREPMVTRCLRLDDTGVSGSEHWDKGLGTGQAHVLVTLNARTGERLQERLGELRQTVTRAEGATVVAEQIGRGLDGRREHFGFADGFSQPKVSGVDDAAQSGYHRYDHRRPLPPGEFVLGYPDGDDVVETEPDPNLVRNGTYMVWRKLRQDVARFRRLLREESAHYEGGEELMAAKFVGRWRDGEPLVLTPQRHVGDLERVQQKEPSNEFGYGEDKGGLACPKGAHIRRTNPRDALGWGGRMSERHRIIRRGMPYGDELPHDAEDDGADRGLIFVSFQADLARQFEIVQVQWCNDGNAFALGNDKDLVLGDNRGSGKMTIQGRPPRFVRAQPELVLTRGCEYLLVPGMAALQGLADGRWSAA
jgi:Dyp-type peroxidase family